MDTLFSGKTDMMLKIPSIKLALSTAVAKLISQHKEREAEIRVEREYLIMLEQAYIDTAEEEKYYAEYFSPLSDEVDKMLLELKNINDQ